jgi:predicted HD phosphohydrolase
MSAGSDISALYREFTDALTEVLAENAGSPARRGRLARVHAAVKRHPKYNEHEYFLAVEAAFAHWEAKQNVGR